VHTRTRCNSIENDIRRTFSFEGDLSDEGGQSLESLHEGLDALLADDSPFRLEEDEDDTVDGKKTVRRTSTRLTKRQAQAQQLGELLQAFALYQPDLSYVQGMTYLGAMLLRFLPDVKSSFIALVHLVDQPLLADFFHVQTDQIRRKFKLFDQLFRENLPQLAAKFQQKRLLCDVYVMEWFISLFASALPVSLAVHTWDGYLLEVQSFLFKSALALLALLRPSLEKLPVGECIRLLRDSRTHVSALYKKDPAKVTEDFKSVISKVRFSEGLQKAFRTQLRRK
jgi:hypothetical protein